METYQVTRKYFHASKLTKHLSLMALEGYTLLQIKHGGMPFFLNYSNLYQQTRFTQHTNISNQNITIYLTFSSHQKNILKFPQQKKNARHYQENSEFILLKITSFTHQKHQNRMSNSLHA